MSRQGRDQDRPGTAHAQDGLEVVALLGAALSGQDRDQIVEHPQGVIDGPNPRARRQMAICSRTRSKSAR
jgi:hypothetical protein